MHNTSLRKHQQAQGTSKSQGCGAIQLCNLGEQRETNKKIVTFLNEKLQVLFNIATLRGNSGSQPFQNYRQNQQDSPAYEVREKALRCSILFQFY